MDEFEREERNPKGQECARPENRVVRSGSKDESAEKIPVFENDQENDCLGNPYEAKRRAFAVKPAKNAFPNENQEATRASDPSDLNQREKYKKSRAENQANPWLGRGPDESKEYRSGHEKQKEVCDRIEDHGLRLCWPVKRLAETGKIENGGKAPRGSTKIQAPNSKSQTPNKRQTRNSLAERRYYWGDSEVGFL
jgi:hypothetical protein